MTLTPAYGRDYKSKKAVQEDLDANKDFIIADISSRWDGKPCNASDLLNDNVTSVTVRYGKLRKVGIFKLKGNK